MASKNESVADLKALLCLYHKKGHARLFFVPVQGLAGYGWKSGLIVSFFYDQPVSDPDGG